MDDAEKDTCVVQFCRISGVPRGVLRGLEHPHQSQEATS